MSRWHKPPEFLVCSSLDPVQFDVFHLNFFLCFLRMLAKITGFLYAFVYIQFVISMLKPLKVFALACGIAFGRQKTRCAVDVTGSPRQHQRNGHQCISSTNMAGHVQWYTILEMISG